MSDVSGKLWFYKR